MFKREHEKSEASRHISESSICVSMSTSPKSRNLRLNRQNNSYLTDLEQSLTENCSLRQKDSKKLVLKHKVFSFLQKCTSRPAVSLKSGNFNNNDIAK